MSRTLFRYIFLDLVKIFMLASGVLSAIMSFGGLLKPLYEVGLDVGQVMQILGFSGPAMTAYSLPIAALFATTIVYGRLGADNEITACRAAGISHLALATPAIILGSLCAFISLTLLCFVVPASMLKVERIVYSNLAQLVVGQIQRTHKVEFKMSSTEAPMTIYAQSARVLPVDPNRPRDQALQIDGGLIVQYQQQERRAPAIPRDFNMTGTAIARLQQDRDDSDILLSVTLKDGARFSRPSTQPGQDTQVSIAQQELGPFSVPSPVSENTKFMDLFRLWDLQENPEKSRRIRDKLRDYIRRDQSRMYLDSIRQRLNESPEGVELGHESEVYRLHPSQTHPAAIQGDRLILTGTSEKPIRLQQIKGPANLPTFTATQMRLVVDFPNTDRRTIQVKVEMIDALSRVGDEPSANIGNISRPIVVSMPDDIAALIHRPIDDYLKALSEKEEHDLRRWVIKQDNSVYGEIQARLSFAVSCFILVLVGCALGMMFRSGNFLSAFAVSVIPALLCIALIVSGQHTCENVPPSIPPGWTNPYNLGVALIWSGNVAVLIIATVLLGRLQRQ